VPEPFVLGLMTLMASVLPSVGTALVWVPVTIGLALTGRTEAAIGMGVIGVAVIGSIDNLVRPLLARWGQLALPSYLIMVSMFGGIALVGASGVVLGPLVLRLAKEALVMAREERVATE
jgi:predicted PurR-regulated permease PerM